MPVPPAYAGGSDKQSAVNPRVVFLTEVFARQVMYKNRKPQGQGTIVSGEQSGAHSSRVSAGAAETGKTIAAEPWVTALVSPRRKSVEKRMIAVTTGV